ncbi:RsmB/NOP family class I SAM-dependent RNA methyltransferase [Pseudooceanicola sp. LIPI14-2-Ac024]|uniref:RsmB/NOP family class I SAM-dependent RNA methyltransferase n=1 Tax=Pseudooceanicola sp. LIPI14-2-Ac024 TaxID=3344875 RepID=UPI0035CF2927
MAKDPTTPKTGKPGGKRPAGGGKGGKPSGGKGGYGKGPGGKGPGGKGPGGKGPSAGGKRPGDKHDSDRRTAARRAERPNLPLTARGGAVALLDGVLGRERLLSDMTGPGGVLDRLSPADKARAQRLATETLRGLERCDRLLQRHMTKYPPLTVRNILRLGTYELCTGGAAHGVVNDCVDLTAATPNAQSLKGLVNAVLRKVGDTGPAAWDTLRVPRLPVWLRDPLAEAWGNPAITAMEAVHFAPVPLDLTLRDPSETGTLAGELGAEVLPTGSLRLTDAGQVSAMPGYDDGRWWVQDAAAALPARILAAQPGEAVLDLCAAPGGKTLQLAAAGATVTAIDMSPRRMGRVKENLARTGLSARTAVADALTHEGGPYDAILLDAPCSATGTIRRHPDLPHAKDGSDFGALIELQGQMIDHALTLLKPGGRLVFCTCSLLPDEGEVQIEEALARHPGLTVDAAARDVPGVEPAWHSAEGGLRIRPDHWADRGGIDGFYIAVLRR